MVSTSTRFKIVGVETVAVGAFILLAFLLNQMGPSLGKLLPSVDSDLPIVGGALVFVGLETLSLTKQLQPLSHPANQERLRGRFIGVRNLVELDIALHGRRFILLEFGITVPAMLVGGLLIAFWSYLPLGAYIFFLGINYVPLLVYAILMTKGEAEEAQLGPSDLRNDSRAFGILQVLILVPLAIPILAVIQRSTRSLPGR